MANTNTPIIDILNRNEFVDNTIKLIQLISSNKGNMTFAIDGEWGCGKTFVLNEIQKRLNQDTNTCRLVIPYNCWQYDYYEEPLIAIVSSLINSFKGKNKISRQKKEKITAVAKHVCKAAVSLGAHYIESKTNLNLEKEAEALKEIVDGVDEASQIDDKSYDSYYELKDALEKLKNALADLSKQKAIVFCVDELDRCLPEYAIKVLERLHHIVVGIPNMITIIAVDEKRLLHTVGSIFGEDNASEYLKKFIRFKILLDKGKQDNQKFFDKFTDFYNRFDHTVYNELTNTDRFLDELFSGLDIRTREQIIDKATLINDICFGNNHQDHIVMYMELFYSVLYYGYGVTSIFQDTKTIYSHDEKAFSSYKDCNCIFTSPTSGFILPQERIRNITFGGLGLPIDINDIFMLAIYYWYYIPKSKDHMNLDSSDIYPYIDIRKVDPTIIQKNIEKLNMFQATMRSVL